MSPRRTPVSGLSAAQCRVLRDARKQNRPDAVVYEVARAGWKTVTILRNRDLIERHEEYGTLCWTLTAAGVVARTYLLEPRG